MDPFPDPYELIGLFETEPELLDAGIPWVYNELTFATTRGADHLSVVITPSYGDLSLRWARSGSELISLEVQGVAGIRVERERGREGLLATFKDVLIQPLRIQLRPSVHVSWGTRDTPA